jgi:ABC-2 type transport system ATP-binding protein
MEGSSAAIRVANLIKTYGKAGTGTRALRGVSLEAARGGFLALIGPDGAGKTTLIKIMCGMISFDSGDVEVLGNSLPMGAKKIKNHIGYLSQRFSLYGNLSVEENVTYFARVFGVEGYRDRMEMLLGAMNLARFKGRLARQLSGGMKQKLGVACGLIHSPSIMFLDEPTTGVDPVSRRELLKVVEEMLGEGLTVVLSTAYMDEAERADRVVMLHEGRIMEGGTVDEMKAASGCIAINVTSDRPEQVEGRLKGCSWARTINVIGDTVHVISDSTVQDAAVSSALSGLDAACSRSAPSMEDLFINRLIVSGRADGGLG